MALEYQLSYTAEDIDNRLGTVNENAINVDKLLKDLYAIETEVSNLMLNKVSKTTTVNGKTLETNITLSAADVKADEEGSSASALKEAKNYTDLNIATEATTRASEDLNTLNSAKTYVNEEILKEVEERIKAINNALSEFKTYTDTEVSKEALARENAVSAHETSTTAHNDIREIISDLAERVNTLLDSDDTTLDQMSEIVDYIKNNKNLIDGITTNKVNVSDIIDNLTTTATNKPLSANQGKVLKELINALQTAVNGKSDSSHTHKYAGADTEGGSAISATKLDSSAGSVTQPVYFYNGKPTAINYTIQANVPSDAKFTDTTYSEMTGATSTVAGAGGLIPAPAAGKNKAFLRGDGKWEFPDNTSYNEATITTNGLMSAADKSKLDNITASADSVDFVQSLTSGTQVGTITINGTATKLYAPSKPNISVSGSQLVMTT